MLDLQTQLSNYLFWDVDVTDIVYEKNAPYVVERVLSKGTWEDFKTILEYYGKSRIKEIVVKLRYLDKRTLHFCSVYFDIPLTNSDATISGSRTRYIGIIKNPSFKTIH